MNTSQSPDRGCGPIRRRRLSQSQGRTRSESLANRKEDQKAPVPTVASVAIRHSDRRSGPVGRLVASHPSERATRLATAMTATAMTASVHHGITDTGRTLRSLA